MRSAPLFVTFSVALVVIVVASAVLDGLRPADADIGAPGVYTNRGRIAQNVPLGVPIRVCSATVPITTNIAVTDVNKSLKDSGLVSFDVFQMVPGTCHATLPAVTDRIDAVSVKLPDWEEPCSTPEEIAADQVAPGCVAFPPESLSDDLPTFAGEIQVYLSFLTFNNPYKGNRHVSEVDADEDEDIARTIVHELMHVLGLRDEYVDTGDECSRSYQTTNQPSVMHCLDDGDTEQPFLKEYDTEHLKRLYRPAQLTTLGTAPMVKDLGLGNVQFRLNALPVKVDSAIELRRKEGGTWGRAFPTWGAAETELRVTLAGQPLGTLTYGIFRRTAVLVGEQEVIPAGPIPRGESSDADQGGADGQATRGTGSEAIGFLQTLTVTRLADQRLIGFEYTPFSIYLGEAAPTVTLPTGAHGDLSFSTMTTDVCEVDANTGAMHIEGAGTCTVTATAAGTDEYREGTATATVIVALPTVTITGPTAVDEGDPAVFTIARAGPGALTVNIQETRTGGFFPDAARNSVDIPAGSSSVEYSVRTTDVPGVQANGLLTVAVRSGTGYTVGTARGVTVTIRDDDTTPPPPPPPPGPVCTVWGYSWAGTPPSGLPIGGYTGGGFTSASAAQVSLNTTFAVLRPIGYTGLNGAVHCFMQVPPPSPAEITITLTAGLNNSIVWRGAVLPTDSISTSLPAFQAAWWLNPATNVWHTYIDGAPPFVNAQNPLAQLRTGLTYSIRVSAASTWVVDAAHGVSGAAQGAQGRLGRGRAAGGRGGRRCG